MAWYNLFTKNNKKEKQVIVSSNEMYSMFSTPYGKIGDGNLALPYVRSYSESEPFVRYGSDNLFPEIINQMYAQSPLNSAIINFKTNSVIGGGYTIIPFTPSPKMQVDIYTLEASVGLQELMEYATEDIIKHGRFHLLVKKTDKNTKIIKRFEPSQVRYNESSSIYSVSKDWSLGTTKEQYPTYDPEKTGLMMYTYSCKPDPNCYPYPRPSYCSALNWCFVDGESSYLHKSNIINSIFPSFMLTLAKKFESQEELNQFKKTVDNAKGAPKAGRIMTFVANDPANLPSVTPIPTNDNDKLFTQTDERLDANICRAHEIDPLIMGIRVSGKLGSGNELSYQYTIYEKNVVMPLRRKINQIGNDILQMYNLAAKFEVNNFQIISNQIIDKSNTNL